MSFAQSKESWFALRFIGLLLKRVPIEVYSTEGYIRFGHLSYIHSIIASTLASVSMFLTGDEKQTKKITTLGAERRGKKTLAFTLNTNKLSHTA